MDELLQVMEAYAVRHQLPIISREGTDLLAVTVTARKPESILEIGTAIGYSTLIMAGRMSPAARITTVEIDPDRAATAAEFIGQSGFSDRIRVLVGDAAKILPRLEGRFDMVFIDAAKAQYLKYLLLLIGKLSPGAVVFADNVLFRGWVRGAEPPPRRMKTIVQRMQKYLLFVTTDKRFLTTVHPVGDGVAISRYREEPLIETH